MILNKIEMNVGLAHAPIVWIALDKGQAMPLFGGPVHELIDRDKEETASIF